MTASALETAGRLQIALQRLVQEARAAERLNQAGIDAVPERVRDSARNLVHYVSLRDHDLRELQDELTRLGFSSLGRCEPHTMATLQAVLDALERLTGSSLAPRDGAPPVDMTSGPETLRRHSEELLGASPQQRGVHIMVTLPSEAASDPDLVRHLVAAGMDVARINAAHDTRAEWERMVRHVDRARAELGQPCRVLFDLGGPKLRTGELEAGPRVIHWRPAHDVRGHVVRPARVLLAPASEPDLAGTPVLPLSARLLGAMQPGDTLAFEDCRGRARTLPVGAPAGPQRFWTESPRGCYLETGLAVDLLRAGRVIAQGEVGALPFSETPIVLERGDLLEITPPGRPGRPAIRREDGSLLAPARVPCTLPQVFADVRAGEHLWLDDGKLGAVIERAGPEGLLARVSQARPGGTKLRADKGINLPDSALDLPALTGKDVADLDFAAAHADAVGLSFARRPDDLLQLQAELARRDATTLGIVLKIETRAAFEHLPGLLLAGLRSPPFGVMVARGDLAVEMGFERLAEVQEEILWLAEAAHVPVIWATQVLEGLARTGQPSRAEVTDAAMSGRAECVMLNKGPHVVEAVRFLDDVLRRMQDHQHKKRSRLRRLSISNLGWTRPGARPA